MKKKKLFRKIMADGIVLLHHHITVELCQEERLSFLSGFSIDIEACASFPDNARAPTTAERPSKSSPGQRFEADDALPEDNEEKNALEEDDDLTLFCKMLPDDFLSDDTPCTGTKDRYICRFPGCRKTYSRTDALRKHARRRHGSWVTKLKPNEYCLKVRLPC